MKVGSEIRMKETKFMKLNLCRYHCKLCNWGVPVFVPGLQGHKQYKPIQTVLQHASALGILRNLKFIYKFYGNLQVTIIVASEGLIVRPAAV